ncbi:MAG: hypothetical protein A3B37_03705 [Candidatus Sungbacteria bacterium RIFCSPLOWO2_01_FULL_59_16]|uniref:PDZ domain-containing protein n=1 Tax=Candidatus Sungbacteria bacterium RIFCSPLOWO2_01_FULL_59_16 TaxID=1802280 RepID=A0A1G2L9N8_9BACT|nr:MAG: hypothetical protein A3B37_03705 [Candidatus Sungbacteria bacterium RIFCSPLOWO2_01_FULL_59_16]
MFIAIFLFILLIGVLVLVHEWGHFFVARKFGVRVEEFAFGFPPRIASVTKNGVRYALNLFPIGGYVKIYGEGGEGSGDPASFSARPVWQRIAIIAAGVVMNAVLAWALFSASHAIGLPTVIEDNDPAPDARVMVIAVDPDSPAGSAGIQFGDVIRAVRTEEPIGSPRVVTRVEEVQEFVGAHRGRVVHLELLRGSEEMTIAVLPRENPPEGEGPLGIALVRAGVVRVPWWRAPLEGAKTTGDVLALTARALGDTASRFLSRGEVGTDVAGPIGIFVFANETRQLGVAYFLRLIGVLSVNLALLNILPIPALDGGRVLFLFIEKVRGVRVNERLEQAVHTVGFVLLLLLILSITYRDIVRFF